MKHKSWLRTVLSFAAPCRGKLTLSVLFAIISVGGGLVPYLAIYQIIMLFFHGQAAAESIFFWFLICLGGYGVRVAFYALSTLLSHFSAYNILERLRLAIAEKWMRAPLGTVLHQPVGKLKNAIVDRVETIELPLAHMIPEGISYLLLPVGVAAYLFAIDWRMALAALVTVPLAILIYGVTMRSFHQKYVDFMESSNYMNGVIVEYVEGIEVIKAFNQSASSYEKFENAVHSFKEFTLDWFRSTWALMNLGAAVLPSTLLATLPVGMLLYINGSLGPGEVTMCIILSLGIVTPLLSFTVFANDLKVIEYAVKDANAFLQLKEMPNAAKPVRLDNYDIVFNGVSFSYQQENAGAEDDTSVLRNIDLRLPQGAFSALVGPSGGGKSTVARLAARFWDAGSGDISIGGVDIKEIPLAQLADIVSFVTQDNFLFNTTLMENIRLGNPAAGDDAVYAAARAAYCDDFIRRLEYGYQTTAGEAGKALSGGERQRIAIARAILKDAPIVILDEATAFTDPENEDKLQKSIAALTKGKTLLVIAHRLSTICRADQIILMDEGRIVQTGTHGQLLQASALYAKMWEAHVGAKAWAANREKGDTRACFES